MQGLDSAWYTKNILPALPGVLEKSRWFSGKGRSIDHLRLLDFGVIDSPGGLVVAVIQVSYREGEGETYLIPQVISRNPDGGITDGAGTSLFVKAVLKTMLKGTNVELMNGRLLGFSQGSIEIPEESDLSVQLIKGEQSNTSMIVDGQWVYKSFRKLNPGENADFAVSTYLYRKCHFPWVPEPLAKLNLETGGSIYPAGSLVRYVKNSIDGWKYATDALESIMTKFFRGDKKKAALLEDSLTDSFRRLARTTAMMHNSFSSATTDPAFRPELVTQGDLNQWIQGFRALLEETTEGLATFINTSSGATVELAKEAIRHIGELREFEASLNNVTGAGLFKMRIHGDYHLGQTLVSGSDFFIIDFEGEPMRPLEYRLGKFMPMKDVGGMIRSIEYAVDLASAIIPDNTEASNFSHSLGKRLTGSFVTEYIEGYAPENPYIPGDHEMWSNLLDFYIAEKALYEVVYEMRNRPGFARIPLKALVELTERHYP